MLALAHPFDPASDIQRKLPIHRIKKQISFSKPPQRSSTPTPPPAPHRPPPAAPLDINSYPSTDLLRLLASLLTQIAATNDQLAASDTPNVPLTIPDTPIWHTLTTASRASLATPSSTLTFHARNIPTITLEAYLLRILKYCPTTNQVFLSLLVYFDRMSKLSADATGRTFVIDSFNIHRLVIAGVTVASKFFSDVFYTNSRYAKVGGLPQAELNQLELQFLLLNDFRLVIRQDEMQRYAEQLIIFSESQHPSLATSPLSQPHLSSSPPSSAAMTRSGPAAMGAVDAYGGRIPGDDHSHPQRHQSQSTPNGRHHDSSSAFTSHTSPSNSSASASASTSSPRPTNSNKTPSFRARSNTQSDTGDDTETEADTETDGDTDAADTADETTDDEPTIRPAHSSAGSSSEDTRSLYSVSSTSTDDDTGDEAEDEEVVRPRWSSGMDVAGDATPERRAKDLLRGDITPERRTFVTGRRDHRMASP
ncbi:hypothetical protein HGRIS_009270 [Hohenbuehelia grisea]|uniref:Cyclin-domain-containing protein n=1 Tax=Hohenbuehelia grisea TaxID=104357 RepID=A0ABR3J0M3_9AGAR